jgi:NADPH2:quinone reductase
MKAVLCKSFGPPEALAFEDVPSKPLGAGQARIAVHSAGVNFPDLQMVTGRYPYKPPVPFVPGTEVAGEVIEVAPNVRRPKVGDRVAATLGSGGLAEEVTVGAHNCFVLPKQMDYTIAAGFLMSYGPAFYALVQRGALRAGEMLLVHGASGGLGTAALDIGRNLGARLIATGGSDEKLGKVSLAFGVEHLINYRTQPRWKDKVKELTLAQGADVIFDTVGGEILEDSLHCVAWNGRVVVVGFATGEVPKLAATLVLNRNAALVGAFWAAWVSREPDANRKNVETLFEWYEAGKLKPQVSHTFPLNRTKDAFHALQQRQVVGKCVVTTGRSTTVQGTK